jgi:hypothetical protein
MRGCNDRATLASSEAYTQALPDAAEAGAGPSTSGGEFNAVAALSDMKDAAAAAAVSAPPPPQATVAKQQQQMWGLMGFGGLFVDEYQLPAEPEQEAVDKKKDPLAKGEVAWGAPLQHDWQFAEPPKRLSSWGEEQGSSANKQSGWDPAAARSGAGLVAAATAVAAAAQPPPGSAISLAMRLVEGSQAAGITGGPAGAQWAGIGAVCWQGASSAFYACAPVGSTTHCSGLGYICSSVGISGTQN